MHGDSPVSRRTEDTQAAATAAEQGRREWRYLVPDCELSISMSVSPSVRRLVSMKNTLALEWAASLWPYCMASSTFTSRREKSWNCPESTNREIVTHTHTHKQRVVVNSVEPSCIIYIIPFIVMRGWSVGVLPIFLPCCCRYKHTQLIPSLLFPSLICLSLMPRRQ